MYRRQSDDNHTYCIDLVRAATELEAFDVYGRHAFRVEAKSYQKDGKTVEEDRPFIFGSALDQDKNQLEGLKRDVDDWHYMFKFAIENSTMQANAAVAAAAVLTAQASASATTTAKPAATAAMVAVGPGTKAPPAQQLKPQLTRADQSVGDSKGSKTGSSSLSEVRSRRALELRSKLSPQARDSLVNNSSSSSNSNNANTTATTTLAPPSATTTTPAMTVSDDNNSDNSNPSLLSAILNSIAAEALSKSDDTTMIEAEEDDDAVDSRLFVRLHGCVGLTNTNVHGVCNPYCKFTLDSRTEETKAQGDTTTSPEWRKDLVLPVGIGQWGRSVLKVEIWNREPFVTDEFLGQVLLPLKDMKPEAWDEHFVIEASSIKSLPLLPRVPTSAEVVCGSISLGTGLIMSPRTTAKALGMSGGAEQLAKQTQQASLTAQAMKAAAKKGKSSNKKRARAKEQLQQAAAKVSSLKAGSSSGKGNSAALFGKNLFLPKVNSNLSLKSRLRLSSENMTTAGAGAAAAASSSDGTGDNNNLIGREALTGTALGTVDDSTNRLLETINAVIRINIFLMRKWH
jgi:hypothetical protein